MCFYKLCIFQTCGHSFWQPGPLLLCSASSYNPTIGYSETCFPQSHPFQTKKVYSLCWPCQQQRDALLEEADMRGGEVRFEEWKWRMRYQSRQAEQNAWKTWGGESASTSVRATKGRFGRIKAGLRVSSGGAK
ncbi:hypothetical protein BKA80DRAFT_266344 [Phyllosticta citrichinensis]